MFSLLGEHGHASVCLSSGDWVNDVCLCLDCLPSAWLHTHLARKGAWADIADEPNTDSSSRYSTI